MSGASPGNAVRCCPGRGADSGTPQRVVRRNWIFWQLLICLAGVAGLLFIWAIVQQNLAATNPSAAPIQLLDIQSATAAVLATSGGLLARARYAAAIRPMIGFDTRVIRLSPDADELVGAANGFAEDAQRRGCFMVNSTSELHSQDPEVVSRARTTSQGVEDLLITCVKDAQRQGDLDPDADPQELGRLLLAVLQGIEFLAKTNMDGSALLQIGRAALSQLPRPRTDSTRPQP